MGIIKDIIAGGTGKLVESIGKVIDDNITNKGEMAEINLKIQQEVNRHMEELENKLLKEKELDIADRDSARKRETEFVKSTGHSDHFQHFIGGMAVCAMIGIIIFILNKEIPTKNEHVVMLVIGEVLGITTAIYSFYYGSSQGSRIKDLKDK